MYKTTRIWRSRNRMVGLFCVLLLCAFFTICWSSYHVAYRSLSREIEQTSLPLTSDNVYSHIQQDLIKPIFIAALMAHDTFVRDWVLGGAKKAQPMVHYLQEIDRRFNTTIAFFIDAKTGRYYDPQGASRVLDLNARDNQWVGQLKNLTDGKGYSIDSGVDPERPGHLDIFINHRVVDYLGKFIGVAGVGLSANRVSDLIEKYQVRYNRTIYFVDRQGKVVLHGQHFNRHSLQQTAGLAGLATKILSGSGGSYQYHRHDGQLIYLNARLLPELNWYLLVEQSEHPAQAVVFQTFIGNLLISLVVTFFFLLFAGLTIGRYQRRLARMASTDEMTGTVNRQVFHELYERFSAQALRNEQPLSIVVFDIDYFKQINDNYGHVMGDRVILQVASIMKKHLRKSDVVSRWGGEEFVALLHNCNAQNAAEVAEAIRAKVSEWSQSITQGQMDVTISGGVAQIFEHEVLEDAVNRADSALYQAKGEGRNQIVISRG